MDMKKKTRKLKKQIQTRKNRTNIDCYLWSVFWTFLAKKRWIDSLVWTPPCPPSPLSSHPQPKRAFATIVFVGCGGVGQQPKIFGSEKNGPQNTQHGTRHKNDAKTISAQNLECRCQTLDWKRWQCPVQTSDCFHAQFETRPEPRPEPSLEPILSPVLSLVWNPMELRMPWNSGWDQAQNPN